MPMGSALAKNDTYTVAKAIHDADIVHIMMPFSLGRHALKIARHFDKPVTAGFHVQAENVTAHFLWWIHDPIASTISSIGISTTISINMSMRFIIRAPSSKAFSKSKPAISRKAM
jgi:hypothetical protein